MNRVLFVALLVVAGATSLQVTGCKSGEGERCQVNADCTPPLQCNKAKNTCQNTSGGEEDAALPIDAPADAPPDMPPD